MIQIELTIRSYEEVVVIITLNPDITTEDYYYNFLCFRAAYFLRTT
jgi:hypothetical protein